MVRIIIFGAAGRMGSTILKLALKDEEIEVCGLVERKDHPFVGKDGGLLVGSERLGIEIVDDLSKVLDRGDVVIDFSSPSVTLYNFRAVKEKKKAIVIGTTGISEEVLNEIYGSKDTKVVISPNMSVGVNLLFELVDLSASVLKGYDVEIVEFHHRWKKDAPSGTALKLMEIIKRKRDDIKKEVFGRKGLIGERDLGEIGILSLRGGDVVGEHTVLFASEGERIEITHRATSRENFAKGALLAAKWILTKPHGVYSMRDVLFSFPS